MGEIPQSQKAREGIANLSNEGDVMAGQSERSKQSKVSRKQVIYLELAVKEPITSEVMQVTTNQKRGR